MRFYRVRSKSEKNFPKKNLFSRDNCVISTPYICINKNINNMKFILFSIFTALFACNAAPNAPNQVTAAVASTGKSEQISAPEGVTDTIKKITKTPDEWRKQLDASAFNVLREKGTERAYSGKYWDNHAKGIYYCAGCNLPLFSGDTKFESGTGWPSFYQPINKQNVAQVSDNSFGMERTEVECARCGGHLGHIFDDGPKPTGLRYCMNSVSLTFVPSK